MRRIAFLGVTVLAFTCLSDSPALAYGPFAPPPTASHLEIPKLASGPPATGLTCGMASVTNPVATNRQIAVLFGGPMVATAPLASISMKCTVQVGAQNSTHNGADSPCVAASPVTLQVAMVPPRLCEYDSPDGFPVYVCTQVTIHGADWFWDSSPPGSDVWVQNDGAACAEVIQQEVLPGPLCTATLNLYVLLGGNGIDHINIGGGAIIVGPDGDLFLGGFWIVDCRPFDNPPPFDVFPDPIACPLLSALYPGAFSILNIDPTGDTDVLGVPVWECPPY